MNINAKDGGNMPKIKAFAARLMHVCLILTVIYTAVTALYILFSNDAMRFVYGKDMLESAAVSTVLSLGGGFLLDLEIRRTENKNTP